MTPAVAAAPAVSAVVITYNQRRWIRECLESLLAQQVEGGLEIVVGDDCSTDGTREIVREVAAAHPDRVRAILHDRNVDAGIHNYLSVHAAARGRYVAHVDGDDLALPGKLARQQAWLDAHPDCTVCWHAMRIEHERLGERPLQARWIAPFPGGRFDLATAIAIGAAGGMHSSMMYRRSVPVTAWPDFPVLDIWRVFELLEHGEGHLLPDVLGVYRVRDASLSRAGQARGRRLTIDHVSRMLERHPELRRPVFVHALTGIALDLLRRRGDPREFLPLARRAAGWVPLRDWIAQARRLAALRGFGRG